MPVRPPDPPTYPVGELAELAGVSVRTLHHYDDIGLLVPSGRSAANHRRYSDEDLRRLRQVLGYRALGFGLGDIARILAEPGTHAEDHLRRQHRLLRQQQERTEALLDAVERELQAREAGIALTAQEQLAIFGTSLFAERLAEAGVEVERHATAYTRDDWVAIKAEADANIHAFAEALRAGEPATGAAALHAAEEHRAHLSRWFSPCDPAQHREVAARYVADPDAIAQWDEVAPGFARYVHDAILANARRLQDRAR